MSVLVYSKKDDNAKRYEAERYYYRKILLRVIMLPSTERNSMMNPLILI